MRHGHLRGGLILVDSDLNDTAQGSTREGLHKGHTNSPNYSRGGRYLGSPGATGRAKSPSPPGSPPVRGAAQSEGSVSGGVAGARPLATTSDASGKRRVNPNGEALQTPFSPPARQEPPRGSIIAPPIRKTRPVITPGLAERAPASFRRAKGPSESKTQEAQGWPKSCVSPRHSGCPKRTIEVFTATSMAWCFHGSPKGGRPP
jgi:hypothetical protein